MFNYHLGRIKDNPVGVVGDIAKARATTYGRRANSRLRSIYYTAKGNPPFLLLIGGNANGDRGRPLNIPVGLSWVTVITPGNKEVSVEEQFARSN